MAPPLPWPSLDPMPDGWLDDTPAAAVAMWRRLTPARRLATAHGLLTTARAVLAAGTRMREPHLDRRAVAARVREAIAGGRR